MSYLDGAEEPASEALIITICGSPGTGKSSLAATFPKPFMIRTTGESTPRDLPVKAPRQLGITETPQKLWDQLMALVRDEHDYQTVIFDTVTGLEDMFVQAVLDADTKAKSIQQAAGGYGAGRGIVTSNHMRVRKAAEMLRGRGINVVFLAHSDIIRIDPPDSDGYTAYSLRLHEKSMSPYVDKVDLVGFIKQNTILRGDEGKKKAITTGERTLVTYLNPASCAKNRFGITDDLDVEHGVNPLAEYLEPLTDEEIDGRVKAKKRMEEILTSNEEEGNEA